MSLIALSGRIEKILFQKESFFIAKLDNGTKISGTTLVVDIDALEGQEVELKGRWEEHPKYGPQFIFEELQIKGSELYFYLTKVVKGVGQKLVKRLIAFYGEEELVKILDEEPQKLLEFKGIKEKKLSQITESWRKYKDMRELAMFLAPYKIGESLVAEIYRTFIEKENLVESIKENPYIITKVKGIGFKRADEMAISMGLAEDSPFRIEAASLYFIKELAEQQGSSAIEKEEFIKKVADELGFGKNMEVVRETIESLIKSEKLASVGKYVAHPFYYRAEKGLYDYFKSKKEALKVPLVEDIDDFVSKEQESAKIVLGAQQKEAVVTANSGVKVMALVGYAGTGKSTTARLVLKLFEKRYGYENIVTTALSGIAAQRIHDTTGYKSATIQSLLLSYKDSDYLPYDVVLLDEASMVNSQIFFQLVSRLKDDATLLIVGDDGQLPPIGAGNVLSDIIRYGLVPVVKLTTIYRQSEDQAIALIADAIRRAEVPNFRGEFVDFRFIDISKKECFALKKGDEQKRRELREENNGAILETLKSEAIPFILEAREKLSKKDIRGYLTHIQVITPMRGGVLGSENLNRELQALFNPNPKQSIKRGIYSFSLYDKVVHIKNENMPSYTTEGFKKGVDPVEQRIFNGMIGLIFKMDPGEEECLVYYPNEDVVVKYSYDSLSDYLSLAYALTIHKTQGMEYDAVIIPVTYSHYIMHNTKLLYTAITRAKRICIVAGEEAAFKGACRRIDTTERCTVLSLLGSQDHI